MTPVLVKAASVKTNYRQYQNKRISRVEGGQEGGRADFYADFASDDRMKAKPVVICLSHFYNSECISTSGVLSLLRIRVFMN